MHYCNTRLLRAACIGHNNASLVLKGGSVHVHIIVSTLSTVSHYQVSVVEGRKVAGASWSLVQWGRLAGFRYWWDV